MSLYTIIKELQSASGSNAKTAILQANKDNELLKAYLKAVYDPSISYYQTKLPKTMKIGVNDFGQLDINEMIVSYASREYTGNTAITLLKNHVETLNKEGQELLELLIKRSVGAGVGDTMILNVFPELYFIPPYQRCSLMDDKIKAKFDKQENFYVQLKLDGSFCYLVKEAGKPPEAITRAGSKYPKEFAEKLATGLPDGFVVIGELLVSDSGTTFDRKTGNGILNSVLKGSDVADTLHVEMTAWDCISLQEFKEGKAELKYSNRLELLEDVAQDALYVSTVYTHKVKNLEEAYKIYSEFTAQGLEGAVIKTTEFKWANGTSKDCVKLKIEFEVDLEVIGMKEGTGKAAGMMGSLTVASSDRVLVSDLGTGFSDEQRKAWWEMYSPETIGDYGIYVTVKANDIISKRDSKIASLFLPVFMEERLDKTEADSYARCVYQLHCAKQGTL